AAQPRLELPETFTARAAFHRDPQPAGEAAVPLPFVLVKADPLRPLTAVGAAHQLGQGVDQDPPPAVESEPVGAGALAEHEVGADEQTLAIGIHVNLDSCSVYARSGTPSLYAV